MDSLLPEKPFTGFPESLSRSTDIQYRLHGRSRGIISPAETLRKAGEVFFPRIPEMFSFRPMKQSGRNSEFFTGYISPGPVV
jgi:hypothetical protein